MSDESFPIIEPDGEELSFQNAWRSDLPQTVGDTDCFDFNAQPNETENLIIMKLTGQQLTEMLSALYIGAEFTYPEKYLEVLRPLLAATSCPPIMEEQECFEYQAYASFIRYSPMSPFVNPDFVPGGYSTQPFLANGVNGNDFPNYEPNDVIVPLDAITLDVNWFEDVAGVLPTIEVNVNGSGTVFLKLLTVPLGGLAVITVDNPPNIADIITGIVTASENIVDLNQDNVSLPPETAQEIIFEVETVGTGIHTVYVVFLPILDDSLIPVRFGGGFRGVQLCNYIPEADMGVQAIRFQDCNLEQQNSDGTWEVVSGWEDWLACIPPSGGGGGGGSNLLVNNYEIRAAGQTFGNTTFADLTNWKQSHNFTKENALILMSFYGRCNTGTLATFRMVLDNGSDNVGDDAIEIEVAAVENRTIEIADVFHIMGTADIQLQGKAAASSTGTASTSNSMLITIIEFDNASDLFVEDIRISGNELQKKIGGVWLTVSDSLATILASIQTTANNALSAANSAISTNTAQQAQINSIISVNNTQNSRLTALESDMSDVGLSIAQLNLDVSNLESQVTGIQNTVNVLTAGGAWNWFHNVVPQQIYAIIGGNGSWSPGVGIQANTNGIHIQYQIEAIKQNQITHVQVLVVYNSAPTGTPQFRVNGSALCGIKYAGVGAESYGWARMPNIVNEYVDIEILGSGSYTLKQVRYLGRGSDIPFD